jgi:hypothetical protein
MGPKALLPPRRGFFRPKNPTASAGCEPANLGTKGQHATSRPPKPRNTVYTTSKLLLLRLVVGTARLWLCVLRSAVRISVQSGSGPRVYAVSCIVAGRMLCTLISNKTGSVRIT